MERLTFYVETNRDTFAAFLRSKTDDVRLGAYSTAAGPILLRPAHLPADGYRVEILGQHLSPQGSQSGGAKSPTLMITFGLVELAAARTEVSAVLWEPALHDYFHTLLDKIAVAYPEVLPHVEPKAIDAKNESHGILVDEICPLDANSLDTLWREFSGGTLNDIRPYPLPSADRTAGFDAEAILARNIMIEPARSLDDPVHEYRLRDFFGSQAILKITPLGLKARLRIQILNTQQRLFAKDTTHLGGLEDTLEKFHNNVKAAVKEGNSGDPTTPISSPSAEIQASALGKGKPGRKNDKLYDVAYRSIQNGTRPAEARKAFFESAGIKRVDRQNVKNFSEAMRRRKNKEP